MTAPFAVWVAVEGSPAPLTPAIYEVAAVVVDERMAWSPGASLSAPLRQLSETWLDDLKGHDPALAEKYRRNGLIKAVRSAPLTAEQADQAFADLVRPHLPLRLIVQTRRTYELLDRPVGGLRRKFLRVLGDEPPIVMEDYWSVTRGAAPWWRVDPSRRRLRAMKALTRDCVKMADVIDRLSSDEPDGVPELA